MALVCKKFSISARFNKQPIKFIDHFHISTVDQSLSLFKIKRTTLTNKQKLLVLKYKDRNPNATHVNAAQWVKTTFNLDINPTTVGLY